MNILSINNFNILRPYQSAQNIQTPKFGLKMSEPLKRDTVSFGMSSTKFLKTRGNGVSKKTAIKINKIAEDIQPEIENLIRGMFADYMVTPKKPNNLIAYIKGRAKSADSIKDKSESIEENTIDGIFRHMTDLNGVKTVLHYGDRKSAHKALDILYDYIKRGFIILEEVEVKRPGAAKNLKGKDASKWDYVSPDKLQQFVSDAEKAMNKKVKFPEPDYTPANYTALHFLYRLPGQKKVFELQMMGSNVAEFKDLDDILYKVLNNKNTDKKYKPIVDILKPVVVTGEDKDFIKYIKIKDKMNKLKFTDYEMETLTTRLVSNEKLVSQEDHKEFVDKIKTLLKTKDIKEDDLQLLIDKAHFELDYNNKDYMKAFKYKLEQHEKFKTYRAQAFLYQREKKVTSGKGMVEYFLPLSEDLPPEFDLNYLYKLYLKAKN